MAIIHTKRFTLRPITEADAPIFARLCNDVTIAHNTARIPHPFSIDDALAFARHLNDGFAAGTEFAFAVCAGEEILACTGTDFDENAHIWEIGYWVSAPARGRQVATEAAGAVTHYTIEALGAETIAASYFADNPASARILKKLGFVETGDVRKIFSRGRGCDVDAVKMFLRAADFTPPGNIRIEMTD